MERGTYKVTLEFNLLKDIKRETLETFFRTIVDRSGSIVFLNMSEPVAADSSQAILEAILVEAIRDASIDSDLFQLYADIEELRKRRKKR